MSLEVGQIAPDFTLLNQSMQPVSLASLKGKKVVLLFYPMDYSPVCTEEHCGFGPSMGKLAEGGDAVVFGVNCDSPFTHAAFKKQYHIPYDLLSDPTRKMVTDYGMFAGLEPFNCAKRGTVVIGADGKVTYYEAVGIEDVRTAESLSAAASA